MYNYKVNIYPIKMEDGSIEWAARFPEVNNVGGGGDTPNEALLDAYENLKAELEFLKDNGIKKPEETFLNEYSGKILLRLPKSLHKSLAETSASEGVSLNHYLVSCIAQSQGENQVLKTIFKDRASKHLEEAIETAFGAIDITRKFKEFTAASTSIAKINSDTIDHQLKLMLKAVEISDKINTKSIIEIYDKSLINRGVSNYGS